MVPPITFDRYFKIDEEISWFSQDVDLNMEQSQLYGNVIVKTSLDAGLSQSVDIEIEKSNTKAAFVTMELNVYMKEFTSYEKRGKWIIKDFKNWTHTCGFQSIPIHVDQLVRKGCCARVNVELNIYWHGYVTDEILPNPLDGMKNYMNKPEFSDVTVCVKGKKEYLAHKVILAAQSPMLEKMLTNMKKTEKNCIRFPGIDANIADELMMFLYQGKLVKAKKDSDMALKLFEFGNKYQIKKLTDACGFILSDALTVKNVLKFFELAEINNSSTLRQCSFTFIINNYGTIRKSDDFVDFSKRNPELLEEIDEKIQELQDSDYDNSSEDD